jgi:hypothetical protein
MQNAFPTVKKLVSKIGSTASGQRISTIRLFDKINVPEYAYNCDRYGAPY